MRPILQREPPQPGSSSEEPRRPSAAFPPTPTPLSWAQVCFLRIALRERLALLAFPAKRVSALRNSPTLPSPYFSCFEKQAASDR